MKIEKITAKIAFSDKTFTKRVLFNENQILNFVLNMKPGQSIPPHTHENSELVIYVLTGSGEATIDGTNAELTEGDVVHLKGEEVFSLKNSGASEMSCFVVIAPNPSAIYSKEI